MVALFLDLFFFKQKTAYEMRISDWSSDVCSSDLADLRKIDAFLTREASPEITVRMLKSIRARANVLVDFPHAGPIVEDRSFWSLKVQNTPFQIGRAS